jgi:hypothetical protein
LVFRGGADGFEEGGEVVVDGGVGKAQDGVAGGGQEGFALGVVLTLGEVDGTVELDDEATIGATEIDNERADGMLASELQPVKATTTEGSPEDLFRYSLPRSQIAGGGHVVTMSWAMVGHGDSFAENDPHPNRHPLRGYPACAQGEGLLSPMGVGGILRRGGKRSGDG